jgi:hypothetical protein
MTSTLPEVIISSDQAVFWMDAQGHWHNRHGRFRHKKIIDYFNAAIRKDEQGYFVTQVRGAIREKVYFKYETTALFIVAVKDDEATQLILNTGAQVELIPEDLFIHADELYLARGDEWIKFTERALINISSRIDGSAAQYFFCQGRRRIPIRQV